MLCFLAALSLISVTYAGDIPIQDCGEFSLHPLIFIIILSNRFKTTNRLQRFDWENHLWRLWRVPLCCSPRLLSHWQGEAHDVTIMVAISVMTKTLLSCTWPPRWPPTRWRAPSPEWSSGGSSCPSTAAPRMPANTCQKVQSLFSVYSIFAEKYSNSLTLHNISQLYLGNQILQILLPGNFTTAQKKKSSIVYRLTLLF